MKVKKCCANCSDLMNSTCCCSLPDRCNEYVDIDENKITLNKETKIC